MRTFTVPYRTKPQHVPNGVPMDDRIISDYPSFALAIYNYASKSTERPMMYCRTTYIKDNKIIDGERLALSKDDLRLYYLPDKKNHEDCLIKDGIETYLLKDNDVYVISEYTSDPYTAMELFERPFSYPFVLSESRNRISASGLDNGPVTALCYNNEIEFSTRQGAIDFFLDGMMNSNYADDRDRYTEIYLGLMAGETYVTDGISKKPISRNLQSTQKSKTTTRKAPAKKTPAKKTPAKAKTSTKKVTKAAPKKTVKKK